MGRGPRIKTGFSLLVGRGQEFKIWEGVLLNAGGGEISRRGMVAMKVTNPCFRPYNEQKGSPLSARCLLVARVSVS